MLMPESKSLKISRRLITINTQLKLYAFVSHVNTNTVKRFNLNVEKVMCYNIFEFFVNTILITS